MNVTTCADITEDLSLHAAGEPSREVDAHLATCAECRQRHAELRELCGALFALREAEPVARFDFRRALWPIAIAASVLIALWPSAPASKTSESEPPTWLAYQRAAMRSEAAFDALLDAHAEVFQRPLSTDTTTPLTALALQP